ncbi:FAD:protein FMN transferase [Psychrosphaera aquimarina]|uniref:FAD:protein FMN transferase n=1 Tax=Psychrosphaera aquimarina TaxID=2044854 RepID=A0ABU3R0E3_9GAMM|nr:FAD:protein FMN transferase [Psychrosphaera aquimarina]MDU0113133.1 FAD:protein FMN transferase [Psychrosphaera aquimarina]
MNRKFSIHSNGQNHSVTFNAMASPCEVIFDGIEANKVEHLADIISKEVWRIEDKYSRYNPDSTCSAINNSNGIATAIDEETFALLTFAEQCYQLSDGLFDITSGVLRKVWNFDQSDNLPSAKAVKSILPLVGWQQVKFDSNTITLPKDMEIDFGGIGKEYAVDKVGALINALTEHPALVNFGGDLLATKPRSDGQPWRVGIEHPAFKNKATTVISFYRGGIATSGDANRFLEKNNQRYGHILNVKTGWPIEHAPRSVTIASENCLNAGMLATLSMLQEENAESFLIENEIKHWIFRD